MSLGDESSADEADTGEDASEEKDGLAELRNDSEINSKLT